MTSELMKNMNTFGHNGDWTFIEPSYAVLRWGHERRFFAYREQQLLPIT